MAKEKQTEEKVVAETNKTSKKEYVFAIGRRKGAVARVRLYANRKEDVVWGENTVKKGAILVNKKPIHVYFASEVEKSLYTEPFKLTNTEGEFAVTIHVSGGGKMGQVGAVVLGLSRALIIHNPEFRSVLKKKGLLVRDARVRERRKVGTGGKARRKKQSPKR